MAKSALRRRRGTRSGRTSCFSQPACLQALLGGLALIILGLTGGVLLGLLAFSSNKSDHSLRTVADLNQLVVGNVNPGVTVASKVVEAVAPKPQYQEDKPPVVTVADFLKHDVSIGTSGAFPYYPESGLVDKTHDFSSFTAPGGSRFEEYKHGDSPYSYSPGESDALARSRRYHVKKAMQHAWQGYEQYAFGKDEVQPRSLGGINNWGGIGITLVDSLDTLWLMNMTEEFYRARDWCKTDLNHDVNKDVSLFETTIRSLGGLLSAYDWSGDEVFLDQAKDLGSRLFQAFLDNSAIPKREVNLAKGRVRKVGWAGDMGILAEFGTIQLENRLLARLTGIEEYKTKTEHIFSVLEEMHPANSLYAWGIRDTGAEKLPTFANDKITFGAMADSFYEYMLKIWIQGGRTEPLYRQMYDESMQGMHDELLQVSSPSRLVFIADKNYGQLDTKMDHLVCFMGGLLALGAYTDPLGLHSDRAQRDLKSAKVSPTKLSLS
jgi:hypothetical protein